MADFDEPPRPPHALSDRLSNPASITKSNARTTSQNGPRARSLPHIKDIIADAVPEISRTDTLNALLSKAEGYIASSRTAGEFARPDIAYKDYLRGYEVVVSYVPTHPDYGFTGDNNHAWKTRYSSVVRRLKEMEPLIADLRRMIEYDNTQSGVRPNSLGQRSAPVFDTGFGIAKTSNPGPGAVQPLTARRDSPGAGAIPESLQIGRQRPPVHPKPQGLSSRPLSSGGDDLSNRFNRLRPTSNGTSHNIPKLEEHQNGAIDTTHPKSRPNGPREMQSPVGPSVPPKLPLTTTNFSLPKPPSPTYSPSRASVTPLHASQARVSGDASRAPVEKRPTYYNQPITSVQVQRVRDMNPYRPTTPNGSAIVSKHKSSELPFVHSIRAEQLAEYMRRYNVLLIDVRAREHFDEGHIFHTSILCIEPISLKEGTSAEELGERLVLSPENEYNLFERLNEFDLVVYYDTSTASTRYLQGPPTQSKTPALRALYDTLYEFNHDRPLRDGRPPALLQGGLDAWVDLMGTNSLASSKTAAMLGSTSRRAAQSTVRRRMVSANSAVEVRRKRMREYRPLNEDEEQAWRTRVQKEEVDTTEYGQASSNNDVVEVIEETPASPFMQDYEEFLRKFPEVQTQQSMIMPGRAPPPVPVYRQQQQPLPQIPSRPAPAIPRPSYSGQAELSQAQAPLARVTSSTRPPLYSSQSVLRRLKLPKTGLTNFGVTCYMNATLQCLSATTELSRFFLDDNYKQWVQKNWKGTQGIMPDVYAAVIRSLWKQDVEVIKPSTFRNFCGRINREWVIDRQQDAKEFFDFLIDCLHEDLNANWSRNPLKPLTTAEELYRERMDVAVASPHEWSRFKHRDYSFITSLFAGQHASRLRCKTCHNTSTTYEAFYSISVEIPRSNRGNIYDCLSHYCQEEMLSGEEVWKCPHCKCDREATKQIILTRLPQILVIHFKRFSASKTESARKIHTPIDFPVYGLRMDKYVASKTPEEVRNEDAGPNSEGRDASTNPPFSYDCYAVLRHLGNTLNGGHYVSLVRDQGRGDAWRIYDDERSKEVNLASSQDGGRGERLQDERAYILFYQRAAAR